MYVSTSYLPVGPEWEESGFGGVQGLAIPALKERSRGCCPPASVLRAEVAGPPRPASEGAQKWVCIQKM
ncbi:unnamed protein product [Caretta caretta]